MILSHGESVEEVNLINTKSLFPAGEYTGDSLAEQIRIKLNESTVLGNLRCLDCVI